MQRSTGFLLIGLFLAQALLVPAVVLGDVTSPADAACTSWQATYFDDARGYSAPPVVERQDPQIDFDWGYGAPVPGMVVNYFSVRWQCTQHFEAGTYSTTQHLPHACP